jgi:DinB superfamily
MHFSKIFRQVAERNYHGMKMQAEGLTNEESLIQPPFRGNCLNWVLGHIISYRSRLLNVLGDTSGWPQEQIQRYERESEPILGPSEDILSLAQLLSLLDQSQERIAARLEKISEEEFDAMVANEGTRGERVVLLQRHEAYHAGQLELLRQLAGKNDQVI